MSYCQPSVMSQSALATLRPLREVATPSAMYYFSAKEAINRGFSIQFSGDRQIFRAAGEWEGMEVGG